MEHKLSRKTAQWVWTFTFGILVTLFITLPLGILRLTVGIPTIVMTWLNDMLESVWYRAMYGIDELMNWYYSKTTNGKKEANR